MAIQRPREKLATLIAFLLPLLLVKAGAMVTGGGPAAAQATPGGKVKPPKVPEVPDPPAWSFEQRAAAEHIVLLKTKPFGPSPLFHVVPAPPPDRPDNPPPVTRTEIPPPDVVVRMILTRSNGAHVALIGRRRYRVGDALGDKGWFIVKIDGPARAVVVEHRPSKRTATLTVPLPTR
ncbi:MAG: hypothetical protein ACYS5V_16125 [Planctomycetota bacterium]|jgi:hypothetical protein